jgi:hypothetical protein
MKKLIYLISTAIILFIGGCSDFFVSEVDQDTLPEQHSKLVVYGFIQGGNLFKIDVSYSVPYFTNDTSQSRFISNASVVVTYKNADYNFVFNPELGYYQYNDGQIMHFNPNDTVFLKVGAPGFETVTSQSIIPEKQPKLLNIIKIDTTTQTQWFDNEKFLNIYCYFVDVKDIINIYQPALLAYYKMDTGMGDIAYFDPAESVLSDVHRDGDTIAVRFSQYLGNVVFDNLKDSVDFVLTTYDYDAGMYVKSRDRQNQSDPGNPFVEPVIIYSNIKNGLGVFGTATNYAIKLRIK